MDEHRLKILCLTFYYRPDMCAGSFRATPLVEALVQAAPPGSHVDVITTQPNRYRSFTIASALTESRAGLSILRVPLPEHESGMLDQSRAFLAFAHAAAKEVSGRRYDLVFATSSRLMTAVLAAWIARGKKAKLYLDIRDIFVDTIGDVLPHGLGRITKPVFSLLERFALARADKVNLVSGGFTPYFSARYPRQRFAYFTNGIDDEFVAAACSPEQARAQSSANLPVVLYAGNIGEGQGLHAIIPALANHMRGRMRFRIIGDGGRKRALQAALSQAGVSNVELSPPVDRHGLLDAYRDADVLFLHLNAGDAFKKVLPSKIFEYAALGKPVWAGVSGFAAEFIASHVENAAVFNPCDVEGAARAYELLAISQTPRGDFIRRFARASISRQMAADIIGVAGERG